MCQGYWHPTLFVGWGKGLDLCELENAPETQKCPRLLSMIVAYKMTLTTTSLQFDTMQLCTPCYSNFSQFLLLSRFSYICPGSCRPPQVSIFVTWLFGVLWQLGGKRKESLQLRLRNLNISIKKVDTKCWFAEMTLVMTCVSSFNSKRCTVLRGNQEMTEKYEYCSTVPPTWIVVIVSVKVSIIFCHILQICYYQYTCKTCIIMKSQPILNLILTVH